MGTISKRKRRLTLLPASSQLRNAIIYILIIGIALFFLNIYTSGKLRSMIFSSQERALSDKAQLISAALLQADSLSASSIESSINASEELSATRSVVTDSGGFALYDSLEIGNAEGKLLLFPEIVTAAQGNQVVYSRLVDGAIETRAAIPLMRDGQVLGVVYLMQYDTDLGALISALETNILRISAGLELAIILVAILLSGAFSLRLRKILYSIRAMRNGDYSQKLDVRGHDEVAKVAREFNTLSDRLEESEQRRRQFVSDASHELKTPLASIKLLSDSILQNEMDLQTQREFIGDIGREADRLGRLSQKLLALTKLDSSLESEREIIDAAPVVEKVIRMLKPLAKLRGITIHQELQSCSIMTVEDDLYQVVFNLVENAIKYNRDKGKVEVRLERQEEDLLLTVSDTGVGIPEEAMEHIFDRFYRVDKARSRAAGGAGLGLSIVSDMVKRNYGTVQVRPGEECGTVFSVTFPIFEIQEDAE